MGRIKSDLGYIYALYSPVPDDLENKDSRIPKCTIQIIFKMSFIHTNVETFSLGTLNVMVKNFMIELFIIIFIKNLKDSNSILISRKEGSINPSKYQCYVSSPYTYIAPYSNPRKNSCKLFSRNALNGDFGVEYDTKKLDSTKTYQLECVVQEFGPVNVDNHGIKQTYDREGAQIRKTKTKFENTDPKKAYSLSDIDIGLINNVDCNRILDVKSIFEDAFRDESSETYGSYKEKLLKLLASELDGSGYNNSLDLLYNRWKTMDNVAMSRGYRVLFNDHWVNREFNRLVQTLVRIMPSRFVTDIYSFEIGMRAINRAYVDGWVLSLVLISVMKSFGVEYLKRVSVFRDFGKATLDEMGGFKNAKTRFKRNLGYEFHDTNKERSERMDSVYNHAMYSCFHSRKFVTLMSLFLEKLGMNDSINGELDPNYELHLNEDDKRQLKEFLEKRENRLGSGFDELIADSLSLMSSTDLSYDFEVIQNHTVSLKSLEPTQMKGSDWSIYLILKHSLSNIFSTNEIIVANGDATGETLTKFGKNDSKLSSILQRRTNLDNIVSYLEELFIFISKLTFFCKNRPRSDGENLLESTINYIRGFEASGRLLGVSFQNVISDA
ncbi:hypothetical protein TOT_030000538 [Theileria orientalis strain Shintoku]|uniref:Uncharacterized protein n=1 Tax=Theileria orientalis strain Shintoku TaxID=869250 RepID=J4D9A0_THEOR|nr:hypothetical protein TOT_030000538 [Theileria orientalis strain Shintoku]BAM41275.1 hypothetical protein TOT_030000538 [Theileria orientalis strain Shintoku]|eukprot:XP_009691576.1 hypothetical protein TOT_030000538 [Theileria orientalis strain Shintoku]